MLWAIVKAVTMVSRPQQAAAHQQQPHDEEDVIGPDEDVIDADGDELFHDGQRALPAAGKIVEGRMVVIEDFLMNQQPFFINVEESLMLRLVGKERTLNIRARPETPSCAKRRCSARACRSGSGSTRSNSRSSAWPSAASSKRGRKRLRMASFFDSMPSRVEQRFGRRHIQLVREICDVRDESAVQLALALTEYADRDS